MKPSFGAQVVAVLLWSWQHTEEGLCVCVCVGEYKEKQPLWPEGGSQHKDVHREVEPSNVQTVSEFLSSFLRATVISPNSAHTSSRKKERKKSHNPSFC